MDWNSFVDAVDSFRSGPWVVPLRIVMIIIVALVATKVSTLAIRRVVAKATSKAVTLNVAELRNSTDSEDVSDQLLDNRVSQRANALGTLGHSTAVIGIWTISIMMIMAEVGINIGPLLASAGILGVVLGFGAQTLVADYLAGISMTLEDQLGVGDVVDCGVVLGTVDEVALRYTRIRDFYGVLWYVRNGTIPFVANQSQGWTYAIVDIAMRYNADLANVRQVINEEGQHIALDSSYDTVFMDAPEYAGLQDVRGDAVVVRVMAKVLPDQQFVGARLLRERVKSALDNAGLHIPLTQMQIVDERRAQ
ncbi:MAG: mechanosensitive ion channel [Actinobacteria bacterium]|jgi:moderate conductance mechanosensitive channel|nr:mechanosensitive ion channel [Actinomycetota bacterium]MBT5500741.1 mechanosensitive ion channel [Actinomycetota bacterium]MDB9921450.1 mechanosensitive ion channel family protein [Actinomycetota bacterium]